MDATDMTAMARELPRVAVQCCICGRFRAPDGVFVDGEQPEGTLRTHVYCPRCAREILARLRNGGANGGGSGTPGSTDASSETERGAAPAGHAQGRNDSVPDARTPPPTDLSEPASRSEDSAASA